MESERQLLEVGTPPDVGTPPEHSRVCVLRCSAVAGCQHARGAGLPDPTRSVTRAGRPSPTPPTPPASSDEAGSCSLQSCARALSAAAGAWRRRRRRDWMGRGQGPEHGESTAPPDAAGGEQAGAAPNGHWGRCARCWPFRAAKSCPHPRQTAVGPGTCGIRGLRSTWVRGDWGGERFGSRRAGAVGPGLAVHGAPGAWPAGRCPAPSPRPRMAWPPATAHWPPLLDCFVQTLASVTSPGAGRGAEPWAER